MQDAMVAFGSPDIIFQPDDAFVRLLARQAESNADIVLGLFPADQPHKMDMVDLDHGGRIRQIVIKPRQTHLRYTWITAVWTPVFTEFMHSYLAAIQHGNERDETGRKFPGHRELFVGDIIQAAINHHLRIEAVLFPDDNYLDIGTPGDLVKAVRDSSLQAM